MVLIESEDMSTKEVEFVKRVTWQKRKKIMSAATDVSTNGKDTNQKIDAYTLIDMCVRELCTTTEDWNKVVSDVEAIYAEHCQKVMFPIKEGDEQTKE